MTDLLYEMGKYVMNHVLGVTGVVQQGSGQGHERVFVAFVDLVEGLFVTSFESLF